MVTNDTEVVVQNAGRKFKFLKHLTDESGRITHDFKEIFTTKTAVRGAYLVRGGDTRLGYNWRYECPLGTMGM